MKLYSISVVIPAYNASKTIVRALDSLKKQAVCADEVIVVDDGSTDDTAAIAGKYGLPNLKVVSLGKNCGTYHAVRAGVEAANCDYIVKLDADDEFTTGYFEVIHEILDRYEYDYITLPVKRIDLDGTVLRVHDGYIVNENYEKNVVDIKSMNDGLELFFDKHLPYYISGKVVKAGIYKAAVEAALKLDDCLKSIDDIFISLKLSALSKSYFYSPEYNESYVYWFGTGYWSCGKTSIDLDYFKKLVNLRILQYNSNVSFLKGNPDWVKYVGRFYETCGFEDLFDKMKLLCVNDVSAAMDYLNKKFILFPK